MRNCQAHRAPRTIQRGFTLIEIIVVVLVFAIMSLMAYGGLRSVLDARAAIETSLDKTADMQRAFLRMRSDFQNVRDRSSRNTFGDPEPPFYTGRDDEIVFVRGGRRSPLRNGRPSMERVQYRLDEGVLKRASWDALDLAQDSEPVELVLMEDVETLKARFLDPDGTWQESWPANSLAGSTASASEPPPVAVELVLDSKIWGEIRFLFRTPQASQARNGSGSGGGSSSTAVSSAQSLTTNGLIPLSLAGGVAAGQGLDPQAQGPVDDSDAAAPIEDRPDHLPVEPPELTNEDNGR